MVLSEINSLCVFQVYLVKKKNPNFPPVSNDNINSKETFIKENTASFTHAKSPIMKASSIRNCTKELKKFARL